MNLITSFNIIAFSFSYQLNLFPTYNSLGWNKSNETALKAVIIGVSVTAFLYIMVGILSIYTFGNDLETSVLTNVDAEDNAFSWIIRIAFLIVLGCHIPYIFFPTKESLLILVDEITN